MSVILNLILIPLYGGIGAACADVLTEFTLTYCLVFFKKTRSQIKMYLSSLNLLKYIARMHEWIKGH